MFENILLAFIPIFVTMDPLGVLPSFVSLTQSMSPMEKRRIILQSLITALCLAVGFIFLGKMIFHFLGITIADFMVAGGVVLMCIAIMDIMQRAKPQSMPVDEVGAVPLGTPLIVGPGVLTTTLIIINQYGVVPTLAAVLLNLAILGIIFLVSDRIMRLLGQAGTRALSKIMALLLAAIAVMMIRKGIVEILAGN